jgi:hypothetical protein
LLALPFTLFSGCGMAGGSEGVVELEGAAAAFPGVPGGFATTEGMTRWGVTARGETG